MSRIENIFSENDRHGRRHFSVQEANRSLVLVRRIVADIVGNYTRLVDLQEMLEAAQAAGSFERSDRVQAELSGVARRLQGYAMELDDIGVELKDWAVGVVDFPTLIDEREAYLCWRLDEGRVEHWHRLDEDSSERMPLTDLVMAKSN